MIKNEIFVDRTTYTLTPLLPYDSNEWYDLYHYDNTIEFANHPYNRGLSMEQLYFILILNRHIHGCAHQYINYLQHGQRCSKCKALFTSDAYSSIELQQKDHRVCMGCWDKQDHWMSLPLEIKLILNINIPQILPIYSQHQTRSGHTYIEDMFYIGQKPIIIQNKIIFHAFLFEFRLWQSTVIHAMVDQHGYIVAVNFDKKWILRNNIHTQYGVELLPCLSNMKKLVPCVRAYQWIINKIRFGFV